MNKLALLLPLLPSLAFAGPYKDRVLDARDALEDGRAALRKASSDCRAAMSANFDSAIRDVEDARGSPSSKRVEQVQLFIAGMALGGAIAGCPDTMMNALVDAQNALTRAKGLAAEREEDRDDDRRSRRDRDRDRDDDRRSRRDRDDDSDDDDRYERKKAAKAPRAMAEDDFNALVKAVGSESFGQQKVDVVATASAGYFTVDQVGKLVDQMSFSAEKVKVVSLLNTRIIDPQNTFRLYEHFTFSSDKQKVKQILGR